MKLSLPENICRLRKENGLTQERLAEVLGVSFAAVSKWERGAATPELGLIAEMAELFGVSIDALIGYELRGSKRDAVVQRLKEHVHDRNSANALPEVEKALRQYPNCFDVAYYGAANYEVRGVSRNEPACLRRALELYLRAGCLIAQNTQPDISETSLWRAVAKLHIALGEPEKGIELLKAHDPCRLNDALIGKTLASDCDDPDAALPYLSMALLDLSVTHMQLVMGYANVYLKTGNYLDALALLEWALDHYPGLRRPGRPNFLDKGEAALWALRAYVHMRLGEEAKAATSLRRARDTALRFDAGPTGDVTALRFVSGDTVASSVDDLGETAMDGVKKMVAELGDEGLCALWETVGDES